MFGGKCPKCGHCESEKGYSRDDDDQDDDSLEISSKEEVLDELLEMLGDSVGNKFKKKD